LKRNAVKPLIDQNLSMQCLL